MKTILAKLNLSGKLSFLVILGGLAVSCSTYHSASYYDDGIYDKNRTYTYNTAKDADYYENYFKSRSEELEYFTDVNTYQSPVNDSVLSYQPISTTGYGSWGSEPSSFQVNVFNSGYYGSPYWSYWGGYYDPFYDSFYWGSSLSFGWGWGYYGYYNPWRYNYWGYGYPYYYGGYYPYHRYYANTAYPAGARSSYYATRRTQYNSNSLRNNSYYSRTGTNTANARSSYNTRSSYQVRDNNYRTGRPIYNTNSNNQQNTNYNRSRSSYNTNSNYNSNRYNNSSYYNNSTRSNSTNSYNNSRSSYNSSRSSYSSPSSSRGSYGGSATGGSSRSSYRR